MGELVVGFDLDMTLVDTRPGIAALLHRLNDESSYGIDVEATTAALGPPLDQMLAPYVAADEIAVAVERFRSLYPEVAVEPTVLLPGAREALQVVHNIGGRIVVVTGKYEPNALLHLQRLGLPFDRLAGTRWGDGKTKVLCDESADVYVGDHEADMRSATAAAALAVGVPTGGISADALLEAGADVVLGSLEEFPRWMTTSYS